MMGLNGLCYVQMVQVSLIYDGPPLLVLSWKIYNVSNTISLSFVSLQKLRTYWGRLVLINNHPTYLIVRLCEIQQVRVVFHIITKNNRLCIANANNLLIYLQRFSPSSPHSFELNIKTFVWEQAVSKSESIYLWFFRSLDVHHLLRSQTVFVLCKEIISS